MSLRLLLLILMFQTVTSSASPNGLAKVEEAYLNWVKHVGSFKHSLFQKTTNKFNPCLTIKVNQNPRLGAFTSVQKAINSLPVVNDCRVVISLGAGIYRYIYVYNSMNIIALQIVTYGTYVALVVMLFCL